MTAHPLDPLSADEQRAVVAHAREAWGLDHRHLFAFVQLDEPAKDVVTAWRPGDPIERAARISVWDRSTATVHEGVITTSGEVRRWAPVPGAQSPVLGIENDEAIASVRGDERVVDALARRGIRIDDVHLECWPFGAHIPEVIDDGRRLVWTPMWHRPSDGANVYAHPIGGLRAVVALDSAEVVAVEDDGDIPVPATPGPYREDQTGADVVLKGLMIHQDEGPSFEIDGWQIRWERWTLRVGIDQREGLVLHDVGFQDGDVRRPIAHRMSIAELVIPYGDPSEGVYRKNAFDTGEYGLANFTNSLTLGCDCLGEIRYLDAAVTDGDGTVREIPNAICLHEEDFGILWKHTDETGHVEVRRSRRFVVSSIVTVNNYEYGYFWYLYQDGTIEFEAKLTGILLTMAGAPGTAYPSSTELEPGLLAPFHQHLFVARLDLDVDGTGNTVVEVEPVAHPTGPLNPHGAAYVVQETVLARESMGARDVDPLAGRYWKVVNRGRLNHVGKPVGWKLVASHPTAAMAQPDSVIGRRAGFMYHQVWVTAYDADERYPAGDYPFQHPGGAGLPEWVAADRSLEDTDVVLWHVFGVNHVPRIEDWPVMPVERVGFHLKPVGFFRRSPGIDVAPPTPAQQHCH
ncbi:MAG TPA: primary-amine oxidase [Candidatus Nanopelagicales bacterium]|nr:primary-amine oxidase [Candidatus Nanopelagicales bacterium]